MDFCFSEKIYIEVKNEEASSRQTGIYFPVRIEKTEKNWRK